MRDTICEFDLAGLHVKITHVYYEWPYSAPTSYVASLWLTRTYPDPTWNTLGQKSFGNQSAAENWILKQLAQATFVLLAGRTLD